MYKLYHYISHFSSKTPLLSVFPRRMFTCADVRLCTPSQKKNEPRHSETHFLRFLMFLELQTVQLVIIALLPQQFLMIAPFEHLAVLQYDDLIGVLDGG